MRAGLSPIEALTAATSAPGPRADLLLVGGDPTHDITNTRDIVAGWRGGHRQRRG